jgi:ABC-type protease/lipase transport system fused ATPase/permease subunit
MTLFVLSLIAAILLFVGIALINEVKALNKTAARHAAQQDILVDLTQKNVELIKANFGRASELHELQKHRLTLELNAIQQMSEKNKPTNERPDCEAQPKANPVNDQITDSVTQSRPKRPRK